MKFIKKFPLPWIGAACNVLFGIAALNLVLYIVNLHEPENRQFELSIIGYFLYASFGFWVCFAAPAFSGNQVEETPQFSVLFCFHVLIYFFGYSTSPLDDHSFVLYILGVVLSIIPSLIALAIVAMPSLLLPWIYSFTEVSWIRQYFFRGKGGNTRWAGVYSYSKFGTGKYSIFLGATMPQDTILSLLIGTKNDDDSHHITIAASGAGKSITSIYPTMDQYENLMVIIDPKGEHTEYGYKESAYDRVLDPFGRTTKPTVGYNPLSEINISAPGARALLQAISGACVIDEGERNRHFVESSKTIIEGLIAHVLTTRPKEDQTLPYVADMLRGFDPALGVSDPRAFDEVVADMTTNDACGGLPMDAANLLLRAGDRERGSMLTTCFRSLKWVNDPAMRAHLLQPSEREIWDLGERYFESLAYTLNRANSRRRIFIVLPLDFMEIDGQARWMRMLIALINVHLFQNPRRPEDGKVLLVLDEFPKLGYIPQIAQGIVTARGAGLKYWILIQNIGQLKDDYKDRWETFLGSSNVQCYGNQDQETVDWISTALGGMRQDEQDKYLLMRPDEVREFLGKDSPTQIVIPTTGLPMRLQRLAFKRIKNFKGLS